MEKLRVLQIIPNFGVGGAEKLVLNYLKYFNKDTVQIKAISLYPNQDTVYDKYIRENKLDVIYLDKKAGFDFSMIRKIDKVIREFKPHIIHSHLYTMKYIILPGIKNKKIKKYHTIHTEPEKESGFLNRLCNRIAFKFFNFVPIALTEEMANKVNSYYGVSNTLIFKNGIDLDNFRNIKETKEEIRNELGISKDAFVIGHVGRFIEAKNHNFLIEIFNRLLSLDSNSCLLLVGDGELRKNVEVKVKSMNLENKIKFLGIRKDINRILKAMDVFVFPSLYEGFPVTLIEAQAVGVRCVISDRIDKRTILSENTICVSLESSIDEWCRVIKNYNAKSCPTDNIDSYDIKNVVKLLEMEYRKELTKYER